MQKKRIFAFGEVLWDMLPTTTVLGGAPFNFAFRVNCLGDEGLIISRLGTDEIGRKAHEKIIALGMDAAFVQWDKEHPTGTVEVSFDEENNPDYVIIREVAYDYIEFGDALAEALIDADCVCFGTLAQRRETSRATVIKILGLCGGCLKLLDINLRRLCYSRQTVRYSLDQADVLKLNEEEAHRLGEMLGIGHDTLFGFCEEVISKFGLTCCLVTLGENGAYGQSNGGEHVYVPGYRIQLADSLGSGDAFSAGFVHKILREASLREACEYGNMLGAIVATQEGATSPVTASDVECFRQQKLERNIASEFQDFMQDEDT